MSRASRLSVLLDHKRELARVESTIASGACDVNTINVLSKRRNDLREVIASLESGGSAGNTCH